MYSSSQNKQPQFAWGWRSGKRALTTNGQEGTSWNYSMSWLAVVWVPTVFRRYPLYFSFLAIPWSLWDLSSLTRDHAHAPCSGFLTTGPPRVVPKGTLEMRLFSSLQVIPQWSWQNMLFLVTIWTLLDSVSHQESWLKTWLGGWYPPPAHLRMSCVCCTPVTSTSEVASELHRRGRCDLLGQPVSEAVLQSSEKQVGAGGRVTSVDFKQ